MRFSGCTGCGSGTDGFDGAGCAAIGEAIATAAATDMLTKIGFIVTLQDIHFRYSPDSWQCFTRFEHDDSCQLLTVSF